MGGSKPRKLKQPNGRACKQRGYEWEAATVKIFKRLGCSKARRNGAIYGTSDRGDIGEVPLTVQCKSVDRIRFWENLDDALKQGTLNDTADETCVIYKRHNASPKEAAWVFPGAFAERLISYYYGLEGEKESEAVSG